MIFVFIIAEIFMPEKAAGCKLQASSRIFTLNEAKNARESVRVYWLRLNLLSDVIASLRSNPHYKMKAHFDEPMASPASGVRNDVL
jgi:hypothetical protein